MSLRHCSDLQSDIVRVIDRVFVFLLFLHVGFEFLHVVSSSRGSATTLGFALEVRIPLSLNFTLFIKKPKCIYLSEVIEAKGGSLCNV